jgi:hypothetical protein
VSPNPWTHYDSWLADDPRVSYQQVEEDEFVLDDEDPAWSAVFRDELHGVVSTSAPCAAIPNREVGL